MQPEDREDDADHPESADDLDDAVELADTFEEIVEAAPSRRKRDHADEPSGEAPPPDPVAVPAAAGRPVAERPAHIQVVRVAAPDPNRLAWPPLRSDVIALICFSLAIASFVLDRWPLFGVFALACSVVTGLSPRMRGLFGLAANSSGIRIGGELADPFQDEISGQPAQVQGSLAQPPAAPGRQLPQGSSTRPTED